MIIILFVIGFVALMMAVALICAEKAPVAYEDEMGFHFGYPDFRESRVFGILVIPAAKKSSDQPADEKVIQLFPSRVPWLHKGIGIAALFVSLLVLLPEKLQNLGNQSGSSTQGVTLGDAEQAFGETPRISVTTPIPETSRFAQNLCVRFSQAE